MVGHAILTYDVNSDRSIGFWQNMQNKLNSGKVSGHPEKMARELWAAENLSASGMKKITQNVGKTQPG